MMLRGWPSGGVEPKCITCGTPAGQKGRVSGDMAVINDDRIGWRGQLGEGAEDSPGHLRGAQGTRTVQGR